MTTSTPPPPAAEAAQVGPAGTPAGPDLGAVDLDRVAARALGADVAHVVGEVQVEPFGGPLTNLGTEGLWRVRGQALAPGSMPWVAVVKQVRSLRHWPMAAIIPAAVREVAIRSYPWAAEPWAYQHGLRRLLPAGLTMPRTYAVLGPQDERATIWMEAGPDDAGDWDEATYVRAGHLMGRLSGRRAVRAALPPPPVSRGPEALHWFWYGRCVQAVLPAIAADATWEHPHVVAAGDPRLRDDLAAAVGRVPDYLAELHAMPQDPAHGDCSPQNLLRRPGGFMALDWAFLGRGHRGMDLSQLVAGLVNLGRAPADRVPTLARLVVPAYVEGMAAEGRRADPVQVRRSLALTTLLFSGFSAVLLDDGAAVSEAAGAVLVRERMALARWALREVDATQ